MAVKFGIRNFSRNGNQVTFTLVALNADGSIDTSFTGNFTWGLNGMSDPGLASFSIADQGQRTYTTTILDPNVRTGLAANFPGGPTGANLSVSGPSGTNVSFGNQGDHLLIGGAGNDTINGNNGNDLFLLQQGGNETVGGGAGDDGFYFGATYTVADIVNGGAGSRDQVGLQGNYAAGVTLGSLLGVEMVVLLPGNDVRFGDTANNSYDYNLVADASTAVSSNRLTIQANTLRVGEDFTFDGSATGIDFLIYGGFGTDNLTGGSGNDGFFFGQGRFGANDVVNGGAGNMDQLGLQGSYNGANSITFGAGQLSGIEFIVLMSASDNRFGSAGGTVDYQILTHDGNVAAGQRLVVSANTLQAGETLVFDGRAELDGTFQIFSGASGDGLFGGQGADEIWGGGGDDYIVGDGGADQLWGGSGNDDFVYVVASDSTAANRDHIRDFAAGDTIDFSILALNTGGGAFTFIGGNGQTGARQVQVVQNGDQATVNVFVDANATPDLVIDVTLLGGHMLGAGDFNGVNAMQQPAGGFEKVSGGARGNLWNLDGPGALLDSLADPTLVDGPNPLHAAPPTGDLLL